jgi:hypothetical protein
MNFLTPGPRQIDQEWMTVRCGELAPYAGPRLWA